MSMYITFTFLLFQGCYFEYGFFFNFITQLTESGHGIMEEPELTLVSTSDISIAEMEFANLTLEEKKENEAKSSFQVKVIAPFNVNTLHLHSSTQLRIRNYL